MKLIIAEKPSVALAIAKALNIKGSRDGYIENGEYGMDSELAREEWYEDCCNYAAAETEQERYMYAGCMALRMGRMLQDIKHRNYDMYSSAMRAVKSRINNRCVVLLPTMREEIERTWIEPVTWEDGRAAGMGYVPLVQTFMRQYEQGKMKEAAVTRSICLNASAGCGSISQGSLTRTADAGAHHTSC